MKKISFIVLCEESEKLINSKLKDFVKLPVRHITTILALKLFHLIKFWYYRPSQMLKKFYR